MPRILVHVTSSADSTIHEEVAGATARLEDGSGHGREGWPVGWGHIDQTLTEDGREAEALVLMRESALAEMDVQARPVAVLHLSGDVASDELLCVAEDGFFTSLTDVADLPRWHADPQAWVAAFDPMSQGHVRRVTGCSSAVEAVRLVDDEYRAYLRSTGCLD